MEKKKGDGREQHHTVIRNYGYPRKPEAKLTKQPNGHWQISQHPRQSRLRQRTKILLEPQ